MLLIFQAINRFVTNFLLPTEVICFVLYSIHPILDWIFKWWVDSFLCVDWKCAAGWNLAHNRFLAASPLAEEGRSKSSLFPRDMHVRSRYSRQNNLETTQCFVVVPFVWSEITTISNFKWLELVVDKLVWNEIFFVTLNRFLF